jgi:hypothetical protein
VNRIVAFVAAAAGLAAGVVLFTLSRSSAPAEPAATGIESPSAPDDAPPPADAPGPRAPAAARPPTRRAPPPTPRAVEPAAPAPEPAAEFGTLRIDADVPGAQVFIDRRFIGTAPVTAENLTPGTHQLNVSAPGFDGVAEAIDVEPGPRDLTVRLREVRLAASVAVVHRHRLGSCTGMLIATPAGVRYETANPEDGFSAVLSDLDTFQVNYQEKNLRLKVRGGREYNFTDPEGNADPLFVFHRDVERARQQLAKRGPG